MFERRLSGLIQAAQEDTPTVLINGARQTGKSTLAAQVCSTGHQITFDDISELNAARLNPESYVANLPKPVVLDEVQRVPEIFVSIKASVDRDRRPGQFLLTGSANVFLLPSLSDSLAGRIEIATLWPLSQGEINGTHEMFLENLLNNRVVNFSSTMDEDELSNRILIGGYPEVVMRKSFDRKTAWFRSYLTTIIQRDIQDLSNIDKMVDMPMLVSLLATRCSTLLNFAEISRSSKIPATTLKRYFSLLETTFQVYQLRPWTKNIGKRLTKSPKIMFTDSGILCHLLGMNGEKLAASQELYGRILENFVVNELQKQASWMIAPPRFYHFRTQPGVEVDLVIEDNDGSLFAIEIKKSSHISNKDFKGLEYFSELSGSKMKKGILLYCGKNTVHYKDNLYAVPVGAIWGALPAKVGSV